ncbi:MAG: hypothetical protein HY672_01775 [Chloroflexi bacterium]|nr:hypothetical protein [Chloroflexota bacterium]
MKLNRFPKIGRSQPGRESQNEVSRGDPTKPSLAIMPEEGAVADTPTVVGAAGQASPTGGISPAGAGQEVRSIEPSPEAALAEPAKVEQPGDALMSISQKKEVFVTHDVATLAHSVEDVDMDDLLREMRSFAQELSHMSFAEDTQWE